MRKMGLVQPLIQATMLALGFTAVWGLLGMWAMEVAVYVAHSGQDREELAFLADGTPLMEYWNDEQNRARRYSDLKGNAVTPPQEGDRNAWLFPSHFPAKLPERAARGDVSWGERIRSMTDGRSPATVWHFVTDGRPNGTAYFVGYDSESHSCIGYLGTGGFRKGPLPPEEQISFGGPVDGTRSRVCFQDRGLSYGGGRFGIARSPHGFVSPWDVYVLGCGGKLYHADLQNRTVRLVLEDTRLRSVRLLADVSKSMRGTLFRLGVRTDDAALVMEEGGEILRRYPIPQSARERELFVAETSTGEAVMFWKNDPDSSTAKAEHRIYWQTPNSRCREASVFLTGHGEVPPRSSYGMVMPSPLLLGGYIACFRVPGLLEQANLTYSEALGRVLIHFWAAFATAQLFAFTLAMFCYRRQVRYGASRTERIIWPVFVLLFGLPGWIGFRFGRSWPVLEACPDCGVAVPRDRESCLRCTNDFPRPALRGTEVFA